MQGDGNLVVYDTASGTVPLWASRSNGGGNRRFVVQSDGNAVVYADDGRGCPGQGCSPIWANGVMNPNPRMVMQTDGNLVSYDAGGAGWASKWFTRNNQPLVWQATNSAYNTKQCTWWAYEKMKQDARRSVKPYPKYGGDAGNWDNAARATGWSVIGTPVAHSIVVFEPSSTYGRYGHVAWVTSTRRIQGGGWEFTVTEQNFPSGAGVRSRNVRLAPGMSFIVAPRL